MAAMLGAADSAALDACVEHGSEETHIAAYSSYAQATNIIMNFFVGDTRAIAMRPRTAALPRPLFLGYWPYPAHIDLAHFSPITMQGALVLPLISVGMMDASATRRPSMPRTRRS